MKLGKIYETLDKEFPFEAALEWDNVGLILGDVDADVKSVFVSLDADDKSIEAAQKLGVDLIISHHPFIFGGIKRIVASDMMGRRIIKAASSHINIISAHTNFDACRMTDIVSRKMGFDDYNILSISGNLDNRDIGIGSISDIEPMSLYSLANRVKERFSLPFVICHGDRDMEIKRVAIVAGSGKSEIDRAIECGATAMITGDITYHVGEDALSRGLCIIDAGHYGLEHIFIDYISSFLQNKFGGLVVYQQEIVFPRSVV